ncbi:MAG: hypothetical protein DYG93_11175 [Leptolyngbya sp. PLA2]|nr:hypothetical protein [Leptolyngbya sp.]MCE7972205.1 hypothetical protein [Leptolyngbya sp. PL-A2]MCQ3941217.1 hypothetical protein [cyanobacterium CYA1]MDL1905502.1 hypothetical protein [Synechococcales cyanobacterium CNB]
MKTKVRRLTRRIWTDEEGRSWTLIVVYERQRQRVVTRVVAVGAAAQAASALTVPTKGGGQ